MYNMFKGLYSAFTGFVERNRDTLEFLDRYQASLDGGRGGLELFDETAPVNSGFLEEDITMRVEDDGPKRA